MLSSETQTGSSGSVSSMNFLKGHTSFSESISEDVSKTQYYVGLARSGLSKLCICVHVNMLTGRIVRSLGPLNIPKKGIACIKNSISHKLVWLLK